MQNSRGAWQACSPFPRATVNTACHQQEVPSSTTEDRARNEDSDQGGCTGAGERNMPPAAGLQWHSSGVCSA